MYRTLRVLGLSVLVLLALGFITLASAGSVNGLRRFGDQYHFVVRQAIWLAAALPCFWVALKLDYHFWRSQKWSTILLYVGMVVLLAGVLFTKAIKGSHRWIALGSFNLQPSEFAKLGVVIVASVYLDRLGWMLGKFWKGAVTASLLVALPIGLVLIEPDFGATLVIGAATATIFLIAGMRMTHIGVFCLIGGAIVGALLWHNPNRMNRIRSWVRTTVQGEVARANAGQAKVFVANGLDVLKNAKDPADVLAVAKSVLARTPLLELKDADAAETQVAKTLKGLAAADSPAVTALLAELKVRDEVREKQEQAAYQLNQALVAIQNGKLKGVGYTNSMQKQLYLPENHTDFIFAIGAEEMGLAFSLGVLAVFCVFFACGMIIAAHAPDRLGRLIATGVSFLVFFQALFNMAVVTGCAPTKGIALPFFSYGGTNLVSILVAVGLLFNVGRQIGLQKDRPRSTI